MLLAKKTNADFMFQIEDYISKIQATDLITQEINEHQNNLNQNIDEDSTITETAKSFLAKLNINSLSNSHKLIFNNLTSQKIILFNKITKKDSKKIICLCLLFNLSILKNEQIILVYKTEKKAQKYLNCLIEINPHIKKDIYISPASSMIINDKKAVQKQYKLMAFSMSRFLNLLNHKSIDFSNIRNVVFIEVEILLESVTKEFDSFVNLHRQKRRNTPLSFICGGKYAQVNGQLMDMFGTLNCFDNKI